MGKLLERLQDASRSGVYRAARADEILDALRGSDLDAVRIEASGKKALLERLAGALDFPQWFGGNWDALEDCLCDLSWRPASGHVLLFADRPQGDEGGVLLDVLESVAAYWRERGKPFFAVFLDPGRSLSLPELFRGS